jgi:HAD superfamily hydrolase (TIGR01509 family)
MSVVLLDAMGTIVTFVAPAPRLRALLASRHGVEVSEATASAAMKAEIAQYRREHDRAVDAPSLAAVRRECADVLRTALGRDQPAALALDLDGPDGLTAVLVEAIAFEPFPETIAVLTRLRARGHRLAVVSNWDVSLLEVLDRTGLAPFFDAVAISALVGASKPDPRPFATALDALGVDAAGAVHVGDTYGEDVVGARAAGVRPILVDRSGAGGHADVTVVPDLRGLLALP